MYQIRIYEERIAMRTFDMQKIDKDFLALPSVCQEKIVNDMRTMHFVINSQKQSSPQIILKDKESNDVRK